MFIDRNYSLNNPFTASSYNHSLLPTVFMTDTFGNDGGFLYNNFYTEGWITYGH